MNLAQRYSQRISSAWKGLFQGAANDKPALSGRQRSLMVDLVQRTHALTRKDINKWRSAWQSAIDVDYPWRYDLLMIYQDIMIDGHLSGAISNRKNKVLGTDFHLVGPDGKPDSELTRLLEKPWFRGVDVGDGVSGGYMSLALDAIFQGHTLMEIRKGGQARSNKMAWEIDDVELVPREHVAPEFGLVVREKQDVFTRQGIEYRLPPFDAWSIEAGHPHGLGLLLKAAPQAISKKNVLAFWDEFAEIFGMPIRIGNTSTISAEDRAKMEDMLANMGSAAWGLFDESTEIKIIESSRGDAYRVYDARIERANSEMSKLILGQTMTMDDGSSRSQAMVHLDVLEDLHYSDLVYLQDQVNTRLIPLLIRHGYPFQNMEFQWDISEEITREDRENDQFILDNFEVSDEYVEYVRSKYRVPITGMKQKAEPVAPPMPPAPQTAIPEKKKGEQVSGLSPLRAELNQFYACTHAHAHDHSTYEARWDQLDPVMQRVMRAVYDRDLQEGELPTELYEAIAQILSGGVAGDWFGPDDITWDSPDNVMINQIRSNVHAFSAAKTYVEMQEMNALLLNEQGSLRPWREFRELAREVHDIYNVNFLEAEYLNAQASGQMASQWLRYQENADILPNLIYETVGDERVRQAHAELDGITLPLSDPFWDTFYPPNGWRCRCDVIQTDAESDDSTESMAIAQAQEVKPYFQRNVGKTGVVYDLDHPYFGKAQITPSSMKATDTYGMRSMDQIRSSGKLPVKPDAQQVVSIVTDARDIRIQTSDSLSADIVEFADEIYGDGQGNLTYIRHYADQSEKVKTVATDAGRYSPATESDRSGILEYRKA